MRLQQPVTHKLAALLLLLLSLVMAVEGARQVYLDLLASGVETELSFWGAESYHPPDASVRRIDADLQRLLQLPPVAPDYLTWRAYFLSWQGYFSGDVQQRLAFNQQAVDVQYQAVQRRPAYRQGWAEMVEYASRTTGGAEMLALAESRIADLQPERD